MTYTDRDHPSRQPYDPLRNLLLFQPLRQGEGWRSAINGLLPHAYVNSDSPVFTYELRDWTKSRSPDDLKGTIGWELLRNTLFAMLLWGIAFALSSGDPTQRYDSMWLLVGIALVLSVFAGYVLDGFCVYITAFNNRAQQMDGVHYDLLSLSHVDTEHLVRARFAAAQVRVWNIMRTVIGIRLIAIVFVLLNLFAAPPLLGLDLTQYISLNVLSGLGFWPGALARTTLFFGAALLGLVMLIEPLWRLRALTAAGMAAAGNRRPTTAVLIYAAGALVGVWLIQTTLLVVVSVLVFAFSASPTCLTLVFPAAALIGGGNLRMLYFGLQFAWLRGVYNAVHLSEV